MYTSMFRKAMLGDTAKLSLDFTTGTVPTAVTFTRADSTARATFIDASGLVKTVDSAGAARFDYVGGVAKGLLVEAAATNLVQYANFANNWLGGGSVTTAASSEIDPAGGTGARQCTLANNTYCSKFEAISGLEASTTYTWSYWIKGTPGNTQRVYSTTAGADLVTQSAYTYSTTAWTRVSTTFTTTAAITTAYIYPVNRNSATGEVLHIWGGQLEKGSVPSSNIITTTASLTRLADDAVIRSTAWTSLYAQPGAMVVEFYRGAYGVGDRSIMSTDPTAARHWHLKQANASATAQIAFSTGSPVTQTGLVSGLNKVAISWNAPTPTASFDLCVNGATPTFGGSNVGTTLSTWLTLGSQSTTGVSGTGVWDGYVNNSIKSVKYYSALTYAEMIAKTT